ncbi:MAG: hypothetical protein VW239_04120 [Candidatus Nanopelagicales bacterium]
MLRFLLETSCTATVPTAALDLADSSAQRAISQCRPDDQADPTHRAILRLSEIRHVIAQVTAARARFDREQAQETAQETASAPRRDGGNGARLTPPPPTRPPQAPARQPLSDGVAF